MKKLLSSLVCLLNFVSVSAQLNLIHYAPFVTDTFYNQINYTYTYSSPSNFWYMGENRFLGISNIDTYTSSGTYWNNSTSSLILSDSLFNTFPLDGDGSFLSGGQANCDGCYGFCYYSEDYSNKELWVSWSFFQGIKKTQKQTFGFSVSKFDSLGVWQFTTILDSAGSMNQNYTSAIQTHPNGELWGVKAGSYYQLGNKSFFKISPTGQVISVISDTIPSESINKFELVSDSTFLLHYDSALTLYNDSFQVIWSKNFGNLFQPSELSYTYGLSVVSKTQKHEQFCQRSDGKIWVLTDTLYLLDTDGTTLWKQKHSVNFSTTPPYHLYIDYHLTLLNDSTVLITESNIDGNFSYIKKYSTLGEHWIYPVSKNIKRVQKINDYQIFSGDKGKYWFTMAPYQISGVMQYDTNLDGQQTAADVPARLKTLKITNVLTQQSWICTTDTAGYYQFWVEAGTYEITPLIQTSLATQIAVNQNINHNFLLNGSWNDAGISYQNWNKTFTIRNFGTAPWIGTLSVFAFQLPMTFSIPPDTLIGQNYIWNLNIPTFSSVDVSIVNGGTTSAWLSADQDLTNNNFAPIFGLPLDPNQKWVSDTLLGPAAVQNTKWIKYVIDFQNIGTAPAQHVIVDDSLSNFLNSSQIEITYASHPVQAIQQGNLLRFFFENIMLPDSHANEAASHGHIEFRIKPLQSLSLGTVIKNRAKIYFDAQPVVITNTVLTKIDTLMSVEKSSNSAIIMYPNPAYDKLYFKRQNPNPDYCKIYTIQGVLVKEEQVNGTFAEINISYLPKGLFIIELGDFRTKLLKE